MIKIRLAIAEDNEKFLRMVTGVVDLEYSLKVVLQTNNSSQLLAQLKTVSTDIILLNTNGSDVNCIEALKRINTLYPDSKVISFSSHNPDAFLIEMIIHGVKCLIDEDDDSDELFKAIQIVYNGGVYMTDQSAKIIQRYLAKTHNLTSPPLISDAEKRLIKMITDGLTSKQIGEKLYKSHRTIDDMREKLYRKFEVTNKVELIRVAMKYKL